jgi:peptidoglycan biosynthesis protein MviN/MurJ (putative lipid II flippase)
MGGDPFSDDPIAKTFLAVVTIFCILMVLRVDWVIWILSYGRRGSQDVNPIALRITRIISVFGAIYGTIYIFWSILGK